MNLTVIISSVLALIAGLTTGVTVANNQHNSNDNLTNTEMRQTAETVLAVDFVSMRPAISNLETEPLSADEIEDLTYMREEEKLARDVYQTLYEAWGQQIFSNIAQSEQTHTEAIRDLLTKYNLDDPVTDDTIGVFSNPELQTLYDTLVETGQQSLIDALRVGATIEDLDIYDLQEAIDRTDNADIALVYENLTRGSRNHLRAFMRQLDRNGADYTPAYISAEEFNDIIGSETERGQGAQPTQNGNNQSGRGWGQGNRR